jgi:amidase
MAQTWEEKSAYAKKLQEESIPKQWLLPEDKLPPAGQTNVINVPKESGALTTKELEITESTATALAKQIAAGALTSEEVVTAFLKRAVIGQQLVSAFL